jgi:outer membrane receptor for ferrienterochelin and colicin
MRLLSTIFLILAFSAIYSQKFTVSGFVSDAQTGEKLIGVNVYDATTFKGTVTNNFGFYSLTLDQSVIKLTFSMVGYATIQQEMTLDRNIQVNFDLKPALDLAEVTIVERIIEGGVTSTQMGLINVPIKVIQNLPAFLGEVDIIKSIQLLPGVQSGSEGMSGMYVRGGGPDQNLILLDGVPVYNVNHLFGFFSVFNPDAIQNVKLVKGGFPARYGGRLSSVLDITMKEGNTKKIKAVGSIGIISSKLSIDGPIGEKTTYIVSGRRTYLDVITLPFIKMYQAAEGLDKMMAGYFFHDLNAKINHRFSDKSRLYLSLYTGKDKAYLKMEDKYLTTDYNPVTDEEIVLEQKDMLKAEMWWGNITTALRWNYLFNDKLFANTTITYSRYKMLNGESFEFRPISYSREYFSGIYDYSAKVDFEYYPTPNHSVKFGFSETYHTYNPGVQTMKLASEEQYSSVFKTSNDNLYSNEISTYLEDDIDLGFGFKMNAGLHWSGFLTHGKFYNLLQPRLSGLYLVNEKVSVKASYARMQQYINLLANSNIGLPTDLWVPVTPRIKPNNSHQYSIGGVYEYNRDLEFSTEVFYKTMDNIIEYRDGANFFTLDNNWQNKVAMGEGWSYGLELLIMKKYGNTTGWIGYTWSKSERQFNRPDQEISFGKVFPYKYDRRHDISFVLTHKFSEDFDMGVTWVFGTGNTTTLEFERYPSIDQFDTNDWLYGDSEIPYYETRNNYRMPPYHRLDVGMNFHKEKKRGKRIWNISVYNVYNRKNPFYMNWERGDFGTQKLYYYSLFPIIPSFSWRFEF